MSVSATNLVKDTDYVIMHRGETKAIGKFTGKTEGALSNPVFKIGDEEIAIPAARHTFVKAVKGGKRKSRRNRRNKKQTRRH
jgi:hypothetical protein